MNSSQNLAIKNCNSNIKLLLHKYLAQKNREISKNSGSKKTKSGIFEPNNFIEAKKRLEFLFCDFFQTFREKKPLSTPNQAEEMLVVAKKFLDLLPFSKV